MASLSLDVLLASLILLTLFVTGFTAYVDYATTFLEYQRYVPCLSKAILYSDLLLYRELAEGEWSVNCERVPSAYAHLSALGFDGRITCGPISAGEKGNYSIVLKRTAYWRKRDEVVDITVELC